MRDLLNLLEGVGSGLAATVFVALLSFLGKVLADWKAAKTAEERVLDAEKQAFRTLPEAFVTKTRELADSQVELEQRTKDLADLIDRAQGALRVGVLFDVYSKQIERYQTETQARAGWSFIFAIIAMLSGLGFVVWGGMAAVSGSGWEARAVGATVSGIGAALSAFITKTFLDVHKLSLTQLNRYFRQPVLNSHILTAQRLADQLADPAARESAYKTIIQRLVLLIREEGFGEPGAANPVVPVRSRKKKPVDAHEGSEEGS